MKIWHLVFLILASCSAARGRNGTAGGEDGTDTESPDVPTITPTAERETEAPTPSSSPAAPAAPAAPTAPFRTANTSSENGTTVGVFGPEDEDEDTTTRATTVATVAKETLGKADMTTQLPQSPSSSTPGFVVLAFIILVIIVLCVVLYFLRKASRTYSFDLHRPNPMSRHSEPTGTFEPVYLDNLDHPGLKDVMTAEGSPPPVANGSSLPSEENGLSEETAAPEEQPDSHQADGIIDPLSSANWFFDAPEEQQNENNNNPSVCSSDPFVEIYLDDAWGHQLLSNDAPASSSIVPPASSSIVPPASSSVVPPTSSSVVPFDSFSLSSSPSQFP